jgi:hypothetical protein
MRTEIIDFISNIGNATIGSFTVTNKLPWMDNGAPLYHHNKKHIYVDTPETAQSAVFDAMNGAGTVDETTTVKVYFVCDAKQLPSNYENLVEAIKPVRLLFGTAGYTQRLCQVNNDYIADSLLTTFEFSYKKLITN